VREERDPAGDGPRLRIGYVYRDFNRDGSISRVFLDCAERLAEDEDVVAVCSSATRVPTDAPLRFETVEPLVRGRGRFSYAAECASFGFRAARLLRRLRDQLDVVHVVGFAAPEADLVTVHAVRPAEVAHYFERLEPHARLRRRLTPWLRPQTGVVEAIERRLFRPPFPFCLAETKTVVKDLMEYYGVPLDAIEVLSPAIDLEVFRDGAKARVKARAEHDVPADRLVVLFVGDEFERKGLARAIEAIAQVRVDVELWVAGRGERGAYLELASSLGCRPPIRFLGRVPHEELPALYAGSDVLLLPSRQDTWGQPVLEALACGRPALASEYTGAHELLENGVNGFVLDGAGSPEQIAALLEGPLAAPEVRARMAEPALETAVGYDRDRHYERLRRAHHTAHTRRLRLREQLRMR
jgi:UDP-glucose:(heptosyl)LPS alpha-1,3-glucosyltransferase